MSDDTPEVKPEIQIAEPLPSPLRCWTGTAVAGSMAIAAYFATQKIAFAFANHPATGNNLALRISITVRTLLIGISALATGMFLIISVSLFLLGIKSLLNPQESASTPD